MKREEKEVLYNFLDTARCWAEGFGLPKPAPVTFVDDTTVPPIITTADTLEIIEDSKRITRRIEQITKGMEDSFFDDDI